MKKPLIGVTTGVRIFNPALGSRYYAAYAPNVIALETAGALPVMIPCGLQEENLRAIYEMVDAVLLPGGGDVDPHYYHADKHPLTDNIDLLRDETELTLARWAAEDDRPMFGICRGHQVINVAMGGTLVQDIPSARLTPINHDQPDELPRSQKVHEVSINSSSRLAGILGTTQVKVNSLHHQSVEKPAPAASVTAYAPDGIIEALEFPNRRFAISVQWHPEDLQDDETARRLFKAFVDAAREWSQRKHS
jgi:putative glutamine amidotransferase